MYIIYKITNKLNNKIYIGQTINFKKRMQEHLSLRKNIKIHKNQPIDLAINKYGKENFSFEIIDKAKNQEEIDILEKKYIKKFNSLIPNGYNILKGGRNQRGAWNMRAIEVYDLNANYIETCESPSEYARLHNEYSDGGIRDCCNGVNSKHKDKIFKWKDDSKTIVPYEKPKSSRMKIVYQYDLYGNYLNSYESVTKASEITNTRRIGILNCTQGVQKSANNFQWSYEKKEKLETRKDLLNHSKLNKILKLDDEKNIVKEYCTLAEAVLDMGFEKKKYKILWKYVNKNKKFNGYYWQMQKKKSCQD